jgi:ribose 5-phosphate isomerase B
MRVILAADHGGFEAKEKIVDFLDEKGYEVEDMGAYQLTGDDDYVDYAQKAIGEMKEIDRVILFCRNGMGMCIVANKFRGVRCGLGFGPEAVRRGRLDDNINALAVPVDYCTDEGVREMVKLFLSTDFSTEEKYIRRFNKVNNLEQKW